MGVSPGSSSSSSGYNAGSESSTSSMPIPTHADDEVLMRQQQRVRNDGVERAIERQTRLLKQQQENPQCISIVARPTYIAGALERGVEMRLRLRDARSDEWAREMLREMGRED